MCILNIYNMKYEKNYVDLAFVYFCRLHKVRFINDTTQTFWKKNNINGQTKYFLCSYILLK